MMSFRHDGILTAAVLMAVESMGAWTAMQTVRLERAQMELLQGNRGLPEAMVGIR